MVAIIEKAKTVLSNTKKNAILRKLFTVTEKKNKYVDLQKKMRGELREQGVLEQDNHIKEIVETKDFILKKIPAHQHKYSQGKLNMICENNGLDFSQFIKTVTVIDEKAIAVAIKNGTLPENTMEIIDEGKCSFKIYIEKRNK